MKKTVLIIGECENSLSSTGFSLKNAEYNVLKAQSGIEALIYLTKHEIHMIIADYDLAQMIGLEVFEKVKQYIKYHRIPVFLLPAKNLKRQKKSNHQYNLN